MMITDSNKSSFPSMATRRHLLVDFRRFEHQFGSCLKAAYYSNLDLRYFRRGFVKLFKHSSFIGFISVFS